MRRRNSCAMRATTASRSARSTSTFPIWDCTLEQTEFDPERVLDRHAEMRGVIKTAHAVRLGFRQIKGLSEDRMDALVARRGEGYRFRA